MPTQGVKAPKITEGHSWLPFVKIRMGGEDPMSNDLQPLNMVTVGPVSAQAAARGILGFALL